MNKINVYCEDNYQETTWFKRIIKGIDSGINPKKEATNIISNLEELEPKSVLVIVGFTNKFINETLTYCLKHDIRPLLVGSAEKYRNFNNISCIYVSREAAMYDNVLNLINNGAKHIAIIGANPSVQTDLSHLEGYKYALETANIKYHEEDVFTNTVGINNTLSNFLKNYNKFDAVVCTNDYVAITLLSKLYDQGIKVPEELQVTGAGNIEISEFAKPSLTSIDIPLEALGKQASTIYHILNDNPNFTSLYSSFEYHIVYRESTKVKNYVKYSMEVREDTYHPLISETYETEMKPIWTLSDAYSSMDEIDRRIIHGIVHNLTNNEIAYESFVADSTLRYRLNRIYQITNTTGKQELRELILKYLKEDAI